MEKSIYKIIFLVVLVTYSLLSIYLHHFSYAGFIEIGLLYLGILLYLCIKLYYRKKNKTLPIVFPVLGPLVIILLSQQYYKPISHYFIKQGQQQQICSSINKIDYSAWDDDYFYLANHDMKFNLNQHKKAKIDDKVCITFNPNQKWLGYAYIFKIETQDL
ncbi:hypothetical protein [Moraxella sp. ZY210820]|uniref:hypothetical protein n=1 Tax=unclassified Moraxella TaxID=2685852 RepID=UPI00272F26FD|nr:hypothetical protein [Moraxella sp. ZY210820]WLF82993.1 hypothetical protein LU301_06815 [Moraxella sp. ZY210820]